MSNIRKAGMLIVLLVFPAFFFLFLKTCGTNHYDLPYFHPVQEQGDTLSASEKLYYSIGEPIGTDSIGRFVPPSALEDHVNVFLLDAGESTANSRLKAARTRLIERLEFDENIQFFRMSNTEDVRQGGSMAGRVGGGNDSPESGNWKALLKIDESGTLSEHISLVLVDGQRHIRGYFDLLDSDDFERAIAEIKILLHQKKIKTR